MWDRAAICSHIFTFIREANQPVGEYRLIRHLDEHDCFVEFQQEPANLRLFRKHFITRHCLYTLQQNLSPEWLLDIGMMEICLRRIGSGSDVFGEGMPSQLNIANTTLRDYYLDLTHLERADVATVEALLKGFWQRLAVQSKYSEAITVLELGDRVTWDEAQLAYRRKAQRAHPDRGGSAAEFAAIQEAYEVLRKHFNR